MANALVSILIPLYNEEEFIGPLLERVLNARLPQGMDFEVVVVDDGSDDASAEIVTEVARSCERVRLVSHGRNRGKGAAIRTALQHARGEFGIIQDSDLEYDPAEYTKLLKPLIEDRADAVYGSRFVVAGERRVIYFWNALANHALTTMCNMASDLNLTDMETGYKAFRLPLVKSIPLRSDRFGIEPELTIKLAQREARIFEVPVSYYGRTWAEGKKIGVTDAIEAFLLIVWYGLRRDIYVDDGSRILDSLARTPRFNAWMAETVRPWLGNRVLEIGAGIGNLSMFLSRKCKFYVASDLNGEHVARLKTRFHYRPHLQACQCDLTQRADFADLQEQVDTVVCLNVLEHVEDDAAALANIHQVLRTNGRAIILVPEGMSIYGTLDEVLGHFRRYSEEELARKLSIAGFRVERVLQFNRITRPAWFFNGRVVKSRSFSRFQLRVFDNLVWLWRRIDSFLPWRPVSIIAIAVKQEASATRQTLS